MRLWGAGLAEGQVDEHPEDWFERGSVCLFRVLVHTPPRQ